MRFLSFQWPQAKCTSHCATYSTSSDLPAATTSAVNKVIMPRLRPLPKFAPTYLLLPSRSGPKSVCFLDFRVDQAYPHCLPLVQQVMLSRSRYVPVLPLLSHLLNVRAESCSFASITADAPPYLLSSCSCQLQKRLPPQGRRRCCPGALYSARQWRDDDECLVAI